MPIRTLVATLIACLLALPAFAQETDTALAEECQAIATEEDVPAAERAEYVRECVADLKAAAEEVPAEAAPAE